MASEHVKGIESIIDSLKAEKPCEENATAIRKLEVAKAHLLNKETRTGGKKEKSKKT